MAAKAPPRMASRLPRQALLPPSRRTFLSEALKSLASSAQGTSRPLVISVTRTLPHARHGLYGLIVDVDSYQHFLPYCQHSRVTSWTPPSAEAEWRGRRWPVEAELTVGFGPLTQSYTSRIRCEPGYSVEALSGKEDSDPEVVDTARKDGKSNPFRSLATKWTLEDADGAPRDYKLTAGVPRGPQWTKVGLDIRMRIADPFIQATASMVADETAAKMIDAFEKRARELFVPDRR